MEGKQELMKYPLHSWILATGGPVLVRAAYSAGKPALGVGPGNVPAYIERSADVVRAVHDIVVSKTFDNGIWNSPSHPRCVAPERVPAHRPDPRQPRARADHGDRRTWR